MFKLVLKTVVDDYGFKFFRVKNVVVDYVMVLSTILGIILKNVLG